MLQDSPVEDAVGKRLRERANRIAAGILLAFGIFWVVAAARQSYFVDTPHVSLSFR